MEGEAQHRAPSHPGADTAGTGAVTDPAASPGRRPGIAVAHPRGSAAALEPDGPRADHSGAGPLGAVPRRVDLGGLRARGHPRRPGRGRSRGRCTSSSPSPGPSWCCSPSSSCRTARSSTPIPRAAVPTRCHAPTWAPTPATWRPRRSSSTTRSPWPCRSRPAWVS